ncbi:MAG: hypothetical protein ACI9UU_001026 [Candidatus Azotimanducaceae bacterium]
MVDALNVSAEVIAAIFGIAVTVVAIIVQLAATRYNHQITAMFIRGPVNIFCQSMFVGVTLLCIWIAAYPERTQHLHLVALVCVTIALISLLPYFGYVFTFISPLNVIKRVSRQAAKAIKKQDARLATRTIDQLQDIARSAIDQGDRAIALAAVESIQALFDQYRTAKPSLDEFWFLASNLKNDPDFVSFEAGALDNLVQSGLWFEAKILHQFLNIIWLATPNMRDVAASVGIATRKIAVKHIDDDQLFDLCCVGMNSLLRACINSRDARSTYHLLSQYRGLAEASLARQEADKVEKVAGHIGRYGNLAYSTDQFFILEVAAFDLARIIEQAYRQLPDSVDNLLEDFLNLDQTVRSEAQEQTLIGVRRAQIQVATFFLAENAEHQVNLVVTDLLDEDQQRLERIIDALASETQDIFWEFTPRGVNFNYLAPELRLQLPELTRLLTQSRAG